MTSERSHDIAVFGATGYTGRQIVRELIDAGHRVVCVGRDRNTLERAVAVYDGPVQMQVADLDDQRGLTDICSNVTTVVNAAGSFVHTCEPIVRAAVAARTHYADISGEQRAIDMVYDRFHEPALHAGVALIPSAAFYAGLADMLVSLATVDIEHIDTIDIGYHIAGWTPSGAAYDNILRGIGQPVIQYDDGFVDVTKLQHRTVDFGAPIGPQATFTYPAPEVLTIPRHVNVRRVRTTMAASTFGTSVPPRLTPLVTKLIGRGLRGPAAALVRRAVSASVGGARQRIDADPTTFRIAIEIAGASTVTTATLTAEGIFDITAPITAAVAATTVEDSFDARGALAPAQAIDPRGLLDSLAPRGLTYRIEQVGDRRLSRSTAPARSRPSPPG